MVFVIGLLRYGYIGRCSISKGAERLPALELTHASMTETALLTLKPVVFLNKMPKLNQIKCNEIRNTIS